MAWGHQPPPLRQAASRAGQRAGRLTPQEQAQGRVYPVREAGYEE